MKRDDILMWSAIGFLVGAMLMVAGAALWSRHRYNTALGAHLPAAALLAIGGVLAVCGLLGLVKAILTPES